MFSRQGEFRETIRARDIRSAEHARKIWPLVSEEEPKGLVSWVRPVFNGDSLVRRSHFRRLPKHTHKALRHQFDKEESARTSSVAESPEHRRAKRLIAEALQSRLNQGLAMPWFFKDPDASDFHLAGNLLLGASQVVEERPLKTSFGSIYRLDVAVISKTVEKAGLVLGGIEIEWKNQFDGRKALIGKSQAFPLISIDISDLSLEALTPEWADKALTATTHDSARGFRNTYVYLHDVLYPQYLQIPRDVVKEARHQYVVFAPDSHLVKLHKHIPRYRVALGVEPAALHVSMVHAKSESSRVSLNNLGGIVGKGWEAVNPSRALMITMDRPSALDENLHLLHLCVANLLLSHSDSLVGYKYVLGIINDNVRQDIWEHLYWTPDLKTSKRARIAPKRLAEPKSRLLSILEALSAQPD